MNNYPQRTYNPPMPESYVQNIPGGTMNMDMDDLPEWAWVDVARNVSNQGCATTSGTAHEVEAVLSHVQQPTMSSLNPRQNFMSGFSDFQGSGDGFERLSNNNPEGFAASRIRSPCFLGNQHQTSFMGVPVASSVPPRSRSGRVRDPRQTGASWVASEDGRPTLSPRHLHQPSPVAESYRRSRDSTFTGSSSLKRRAGDPTTAPRGKSMKITDLPSSSRLSTPSGSTQSFPIRTEVLAATPGEGPQLTGQKCFICKRDVAVTPEGREELLEKPIQVAVLPCGHCYHDQCLESNSPADQRANPPCLACAWRLEFM